jgi:hypothetical protein
VSLVAEWRARVTEERVDALIVQASDLLEVAELYPMRLPGQRARRQASYLRSRAEELWQTMTPTREDEPGSRAG